jgi:hypothetical protein
MPMSLSTLRSAAMALILASTACASYATLITFDEHPWVLGPDEYAWYANPIDDVYAPLGVDIGSGYLQPAGQDTAYPSQHLLGGPSFTIRFTGTLPTYVSLSFTSPSPNLRSTVSSSGPGSFAAMADTGGFYWGGEDVGFVETPFRGPSVANFHSAQGIALLEFDTYAMSRNIGKIDNLYFGNVAAVPEPGVLALAAVGLGLIGVMARRQRRRAAS